MLKIVSQTWFVLTIVTTSFAQNLVPYQWQLEFNDGSSHEINLLLSWERQGLSYLSQPGTLSNTFYIPKKAHPADFTLEIQLLAQVGDIFINDHLIGGNFNTPFIWSASPEYESRKFNISKELLNLGGENSITIACADYSYTGGINHNFIMLYASPPTNSSIRFSFRSDEHLFNDQDDVSFDLITRAASDGHVSLIIRNDFRDALVTKELKVKKGIQESTLNLGPNRLPPGIYEIMAVLNDQGYIGATTYFVVSPTAMERSSPEPRGYKKYWDGAMKELEKVKPYFKINQVDSLSTEKRNGFVVEMQSIGNVTIRGYYFVPKGKKKYPAILNLPGYGYGFEYLDEFLKVDEEVIELAICVRGHGISLEAFSTEFPVPGFIGYEICDKEKIAYRQIYMDCLRALEFLLSRDEVDQAKIGVLGGSQGGGMALMTAGLMPDKVHACAYFDPFPTDLSNHIEIRTLIEDELKSYLKYYGNTCDMETARNTFSFLDTRHFAKKITCPVLYVTGLRDDDCPPRLGFSAYNEITAHKSFKIFPGDSHIGESNWKETMMSFFKEEFGF